MQESLCPELTDSGGRKADVRKSCIGFFLTIPAPNRYLLPFENDRLGTVPGNPDPASNGVKESGPRL